MMKQCMKCGEWKEENMFNVRSDSLQFRNECKACQSSYNAAYHIIHFEDAIAYNKNYYSGHKKENLENHRKYRKKNPGWQEAYNKKYYMSHANKIKAYASVYRHEHPEENTNTQRRWRACRSGSPINDYNIHDWMAILDIYDHRCAYCRRYGKPLTQDHVIPLSRGGNHSVDNIVPACRSCNSSKHNHTPEEWISCQPHFELLSRNR